MSKRAPVNETLKVDTPDEGRIDKFLASHYPDVSRTYFKRLINNRNILIDGHPVTAHHLLRKGQNLSINWPQVAKVEMKKRGTLPFPVLFEDDHLMVINKPSNLMCHPAGWKRRGDTLVEILAPVTQSQEWPDEVRPGLVHRLDRDTSGILLFAKTPESHPKLSKQFSNRQVKKTYLALVQGIMKSNEGTLECKMGRDPQKRQRFAVIEGGRLAITKFKVLERIGTGASLVELSPLTGRTHQLRVQLATFGHPILGDKVYGQDVERLSAIKRQMLHAFKLKFFHPKTGLAMEFEAPVPEDFQEGLKVLRSTYASTR